MSVAISSAAIAVSTSANIAASNARLMAEEAKCEIILNNYNSKTASIQDMKGYSTCVEILHPTPNEPMNDTGILFVKFGILLLIAAFVVGLIRGYKEQGELCLAFMEGIVYSVVLLVVGFVLFLILSGAVFIISG